MPRRRRRSNNPDGRPSQGLTEASAIVRLPRALLDAADAAARAEGVSRAEWIRRAMAQRLECYPEGNVGVSEAEVEAVS
jgi:predicted HicB family RNase H-like nuclease